MSTKSHSQDEFEESGPPFLYHGEFYSDDLHPDESYLNQDESCQEESYLNQDETCQDESYQSDSYQDKSQSNESYQGGPHQDKSFSNESSSQAGPSTCNETYTNDG
ncbi:30257_t:CDS:1, partial [Racocetra persica]